MNSRFVSKVDEFRAGFTRIIDKATSSTEEALEKGETKLVKTKNGYEEHLIPVGAKDATMIAAISYDKLRLSENKATTISQGQGNSSLQAKLEELSDKVDEAERKAEAKVVNEQ